MQNSYRLPHPLPPLPVRKGVRGRRPKSQTIALLKAAAEAAAAAKKAPKPSSRVNNMKCSIVFLNFLVLNTTFKNLTFVPSLSVCVYVNKHGDYGPNLDRKLVQQLPDHFGPAPVNSVLQQAVQACVDCTYTPSGLLSFLQSQSHSGGEVIRVRSDHGIRYVKLPSVSSASSVLRFLENLCSHLESDCVFSSQPFSPFTNNKRSYERSKSGQANYGCVGKTMRYIYKNGLSNENSSKDNTPIPRPPHNNAADYRAAKKERAFYHGHTQQTPSPLRRVNSNPSDITPAHINRRVEAPSSTTGPDHMKQDTEPSGNDASSWTVEEVIRFVQEADPQTLGPHVDLFRKHEIDGKALMLLRSDVIMKYMGLKLGPALKLCHHIEKLKHSKP
uniref:SAM domain-containing protein n=1 Tax=Periophthalmus magnuspinnatus TaxID=409849 RepID=A0A3B4B5N9_9GOBI